VTPALLLDTNAYGAFKCGAEEIIEAVARIPKLYLPLIVLAELLAGFAIGARTERNRNELARFMASPRVSVLTPDQSTAEFYARIFPELCSKGKSIPTNDLWIAALARQHELPLLTLDRHLGMVPSLRSGALLRSFE
jgi:tRNA(fMet)-specific endonuclease VapC